jgi:protocatechuate 3,4-dioxygenase beta subunit
MESLQTVSPFASLLRPSSVFRAIALAMLLCPIAARATSCIGPITVCSSYAASAVVFRGRVLDVNWDAKQPVESTYPDGSTVQLVSGPASAHVRFAVEETFRGDAGSEIVIAAGGWGPSFEKGKEYLVFAFSNSASKELSASVCSNTHQLTEPTDDSDLAWLRAYPSSDGSGFLFGQFFMRGSDQMTLAESQMPAPVAVRITGNGFDKTIFPVHEKYRVDALAAGTYTVAAVVPAGVVTDKPHEVKLAPRSCAEVDWWLHNDSHIMGRVTDESGMPAARVDVSLVKREQNRSGFTSVTRVQTDAEGRYDFARVAAGDYLVAIHALGPTKLDPYRKVFYPGVADVASAKTIHLDAAATVADIDLITPPALVPATVHVKVLQRDGTPVDRAQFAAIDAANPGWFTPATADETGSANLALYAGEEYTVTATTPGVREPSCGGPVSFVARDEMTLDPLRLDKSWHECRAPRKTTPAAAATQH